MGFGGLIQDAGGNWLLGFLGRTKEQSILFAELWAISSRALSLRIIEGSIT